MSGRDIALTGVPRSGTTLCCNLLGQAKNTVALFEPMPVHRLPLQRDAAIQQVQAFFAQSRQRLLASGMASSQQVGGQVPDNPFSSQRDDAGQRRREAELGDIRIDKPLTSGFTLVVKHNAAFTALLPELAQAFDCYAVIRNPLAVLASWNSVALPVASGRLPAGERLDPLLAARLEAEPELLARQLVLLDWLFSRFADQLPATRVLRYEAVVASRAAELAAITEVAVPALPLRSRNSSALYDRATALLHAERLRRDAGAWRAFYSDDDIDSVLESMQEPR